MSNTFANVIVIAIANAIIAGTNSATTALHVPSNRVNGLVKLNEDIQLRHSVQSSEFNFRKKHFSENRFEIDLSKLILTLIGDK